MNNRMSCGAWLLCWGSFGAALLISFLLMELGVRSSIVVLAFLGTFFGIIILFCIVSIHSGKKRASRDEKRKQASHGGYGFSTQSQSSYLTPNRRVCLNCGSLVDEDDKFCKNCGVRF